MIAPIETSFSYVVVAVAVVTQLAVVLVSRRVWKAADLSKKDCMYIRYVPIHPSQHYWSSWRAIACSLWISERMVCKSRMTQSSGLSAWLTSGSWRGYIQR